jgi:hypothetical protein
MSYSEVTGSHLYSILYAYKNNQKSKNVQVYPCWEGPGRTLPYNRVHLLPGLPDAAGQAHQVTPRQKPCIAIE